MIAHPQLRVRLDTIKESDIGALREWRNNPSVFKWCRQNDLINNDDQKRWYEKQASDTKTKMYLIKENEQYTGIGVCGLTNIDLINQRAEFSLYISRENQGNGYGRDALKLLCLHGFNAYPLRIIWGESFKDNPAIKMFLDIGFKEEGLRRDFYYRDGEFTDAVLFSIKKEELII